MIRELFIFVYLFVFRLFFHLFRLFPQKKKTVFVTSFGDNVLYTAREVDKLTDHQVVIVKTAQCKVDFSAYSSWNVVAFEPSNPTQWLRSIYHLATCRTVFVDNYFGFLAVTKFKDNVKCIQLWHAAGAIKKFALEDPSIAHRSAKAIQRFKEVYNRFDYVAVGSERMAEIFVESFGLPDERMLRVGIPRTDFFFNEEQMHMAQEALQEQLPLIKQKKVILYAPTFRQDQFDNPRIALDLDLMYKNLRHHYIVLLKLHPSVNLAFENQHHGFVYNVSNGFDMNELLTVTDILITDYSSIPFEYSLLQRPMIFYAYDLEDYRKERGFWEDYESMLPGPVVHHTKDIIQSIKDYDFDIDGVRTFARKWNQYSDGMASRKLVERLYDVESSPAES